MEYPLCDQVVTCYRKTPEGVRRQVLEGCYMEFQTAQDRDVALARTERPFLLVIPAGRGTVQVGDRVIPGIGPENVDWAGFVPAAVENLAQVGYVKKWYWDGKLSHVEAGRK